ncbi:hypothetical protein BH11PSE2_BH11PSE2_07570 [soil metagenome]
MGGADKVVRPDSARGYIGTNNVLTLIDQSHRTIVRATDKDDSRYLVLKRFVLGDSRTGITSDSELDQPSTSQGDPLFDIYSASDEPFYVARETDITLDRLGNSHLWLSGPSGVGKTAALRRYGCKRGTRVIQVMLGSYRGETPVGLIRAICIEMAAIAGDSQMPSDDAPLFDLISFAKRAALSLRSSAGLMLLIEEIPLPPGNLYKEFLSNCLQLALAIDNSPADGAAIVLAFSSIQDPAQDIEPKSAKLRERVQFLKLGTWSEPDIIRLIDVLAPIIRPTLNSQERTKISEASKGSPRFVKMLFRRWRNGTEEGVQLRSLLDSVGSEQL